MKTSDAVVLAGVLVLAALVVALVMKRPARAQAKPRTLAIIGDSIGLGATEPLLKLARAGGIEGQGFDVVGTTAAEWLRNDWVADVVASGMFDAFVVSLGTNDANGRTPAATLHRQFQEVADRITGAGSSVYWLEPPTTSLDRAEEVRDIIRGLQGVTVVAGPGVDMTSAGIHPTGTGYATLAGRLWKALAAA